MNKVKETVTMEDVLFELRCYMSGRINAKELCPYGENMRLDAITFSRYDRKIKGFEIKLTRADFLSDKKWYKYLPFCHHFYFIAPRGVIKKEELPPKIGLIEVWKEAWYDFEPEEGRIERWGSKSEIVKKCRALEPVSPENYTKILEGIVWKMNWKPDNLI